MISLNKTSFLKIEIKYINFIHHNYVINILTIIYLKMIYLWLVWWLCAPGGGLSAEGRCALQRPPGDHLNKDIWDI